METAGEFKRNAGGLNQFVEKKTVPGFQRGAEMIPKEVARLCPMNPTLQNASTLLRCL